MGLIKCLFSTVDMNTIVMYNTIVVIGIPPCSLHEGSYEYIMHEAQTEVLRKLAMGQIVINQYKYIEKNTQGISKLQVHIPAMPLKTCLRWVPNANEINTQKHEMYMANARNLRLGPYATYISLTCV